MYGASIPPNAEAEALRLIDVVRNSDVYEARIREMAAERERLEAVRATADAATQAEMNAAAVVKQEREALAAERATVAKSKAETETLLEKWRARSAHTDAREAELQKGVDALAAERARMDDEVKAREAAAANERAAAARAQEHAEGRLAEADARMAAADAKLAEYEGKIATLRSILQ